MNRSVFLGGVIIILLGLLAAYYILGGFQEPQIEQESFDGYILAGLPFEGSPGSKELRTYFMHFKTALEEERMEGTLALINEQPLNQEQVQFFIGVIMEEQFQDLPDSLEMKRIPAGEKIKASINSHPLVAPLPEKVHQKMIEFAEKKQLRVEDYSLEKYFPNNHIVVELFVKP